MSLTSYFLSSHVKFMSEQAILIPGQTPPGDSRFQFVPQGEHAALLLLTTQTEKIQDTMFILLQIIIMFIHYLVSNEANIICLQMP